ncbi:MAG: UDP-3-O-(3-hydroxymyristoyl)glucosamine N-acyltransferase [Puniceicoccales bacterium]|nr:UDP-3-O-(3-hydroxymyristoyl)glucosamine N-acyltransferase [Puniceicoccales bacterium]
MRYGQERLRKLLQPEEVRGNFSGTVHGIASLDRAGPGELSFLSNGKYTALVPNCRASILLLPKDYVGEPPPGGAYFLLENPSLAIGILCEEIERKRNCPPKPGVHPSAVLSETAKIHPSASVGPFCVIGREVCIGARCRIGSHCTIGDRCFLGEDILLHPQVTLYPDCAIGDRCIIHSGAVVGSDGYGYVWEKGKQQKLPHVGRIVVAEEVEIGANCCIDRARFAETTIGAGTKLDNLVQIGHNVSIGKNCLLVAQSGVAGSTELGDGVVLGGQVGIAGHLKIGSGVQIAAQSGVTADLPPRSVVRGTPALPLGIAGRLYVYWKYLPELFRRVEKLEKGQENVPHQL